MVNGLFVESYRKLLHGFAWSVLAYFKNWLVINHSCTWSFALCLVPFHQNNKKKSFPCLPQTDSHRQLLSQGTWNTETEILISPTLFFHQWNYNASTGVTCWCQHKREKNQAVVWPVLKQQYLWLNILQYELWAVLLGDVCWNHENW